MRWKRREKVTKGVVQIRDALPLLNCAGAKAGERKKLWKQSFQPAYQQE